MLFGANADPSVRSKGGQTPQHEAESNGQREAAKLFETVHVQSARAELVVPEPPSLGLLGLTRIRTHPARSEAVSVAERATQHRWALGDLPAVLTDIQARHAWFESIAVDPQGKAVAVTTPEKSIELRRWDDLQVVTELPCPTEGWRGAQGIDFSPDGRWLAIADSCEQVHLIERATGEVVSRGEAGERNYCTRFDPFSRQLATACSFQGGGFVQIDQIEDGRLVPVQQLDRSDHRTPATQFVDTLAHLSFSPDGRSLALFETSGIGY